MPRSGACQFFKAVEKSSFAYAVSSYEFRVWSFNPKLGTETRTNARLATEPFDQPVKRVFQHFCYGDSSTA
jgi:hypothetical protein